MTENPLESLGREVVPLSATLNIQHGKSCTTCREKLLSPDAVRALDHGKINVIFTRDIRTLEPQICHVCAIVNHYLITDEGYREMQAVSAAQGVPLPPVLWRCRHVGAFSIFNNFEPSTVDARFFLSLMDVPESPELVPRKQLSNHLDCVENWELANHWIHKCRTTHTVCNKRPDDSFMPTRVLFLGDPGKQPCNMRLIATETLSPRSRAVPYMTLSHVWGTTETLALTSSTLPTLTAGIPLSALPPTFHDAVRTTQALGIRYLWIDKLCIIQNDALEWRHEAARMEFVYRNSYCNIVALDSPNDSAGFLNSRNPMTIEPFTIGPDQSMAYFDLQRHREHILDTRAWCLQEQLLSPRLLTFGRRQMAWVCRENRASEIFPETTGEAHDGYEFLVRSYLAYTWPPAKWFGWISDPLQVWNYIVGQYTSRNLSHEEDKLYAVSGFARSMRRLGRYAAGMWVDHFLSLLIWRVDSRYSRSLGRRPETFRAPTWSWASIEGKVWNPQSYWIDKTYRWWAEVLSVDVKTIDGDVFSQVLSGEARLRGRLKQATWEIAPASEGDRSSDEFLVVSFRVDDWVHVGEKLRFDVDINVSQPPAEILLFPIVHVPNMPQYDIHGLVLEKTVDGRYRRLGVFDLPLLRFGDEIDNWKEAEVCII